MRLKEAITNANTGLDAIKRAPVLDYPTDLRCIRIQDISQAKPYEEWAYTETSKDNYKKFKLAKGDILVARTGATVGVSYYVNKDLEAVYNNGTIRLKINEENDSRYIFYITTTKEFRQYIDNVSCVATQPNLRIENLLRFQCPDKDLEEQKAIASVLSAYDDLMEKNNRKIEILQDMAEELYKEWFVRFRFPGYKTAKFTDGIPDGWEVDKIESLGVFTRGKNITASEMIDGSIPVISAGIEPSGFHNESNVKGVSITISSSGANAGYMRINYSDIWAADCMYVNNIDNVFYLYELLNNIRPCIDNLQRGAAQPHVYSKDVNRLKILLPAEEVRNKFNDLVKDMHLSIATLMKQNNNLKQQRDLLLPRLMSGKLEVKVS
jgi:type I restriction enzyme, S subunit